MQKEDKKEMYPNGKRRYNTSYLSCLLGQKE
jgi:hypothetical protein